MQKVSQAFFTLVEQTEDNQVNDSIPIEIDSSANNDKSNSSIQDLKYCSICCAAKYNAILMDCGHAGICFECACELWKHSKKCHICRSNIEKILQFSVSSNNSVQIIKAVKLRFQ